jgi:nucleotide-binding universal stress UspA family protein
MTVGTNGGTNRSADGWTATLLPTLEREGEMYRAIVVGTDGSRTAKLAVIRAAELARDAGGKLVLVSAYRPVVGDKLRAERAQAPDDVSWAINPDQEVEAILSAAAVEARAAGATDVVTRAVQGPPAEALLEVAEEVGAGLIVVGNMGMTGTKRFLIGSVPNRISHHAPCDVLIVRTDVAAD